MNEAAGDAADGRPHSGFNYNANVGSNEDGGRFVPPTHPEASSVETNANAMVEGSIRADYDAAHSFAASHDSFSRRQTTEGSGAAAEGHSEAPAGGGSSETGNSAPEAPLRKGKWTAEEVAYTTAIIADFSSGYLPVPAGTTLRTSLSERLHCDPMRITKKFAGASCIGKQVFQPCDPNDPQHKDALTAAQTKLAQLEQAFRARLADQKPTKASSLEPRGLSGDSGSSGSGGNGGSGGNAGSGSNDSKVRSNGKSSTSGNASSTSGSSSGCSSGSRSSAQKAKGGGRKRSGSGGSSTAGSKPSVITEDQRQFLPPDRRRDRGHLQQHQQPPPPPPLSLSGIVRSVGATSIEHFAGLFESAINENTAVAVAPGQLRAYAHLHGGPPYGDRQPFSSSSSLAVPYPPHHHHPGYSSGGSYSGNYDSTSGGAGYSHNSGGNKNHMRHEMSSPLNDSYGHYDMDSSVEDAGAPRSPSLNRRSRRGSFDELTAAAAMVDAHSSSSSSSSSNHHDDGGSHSHSSEGHSSNGVRKGAPPRVFADGYAYRSDELQGGGGIARQGAGVGSIDLGVFGSMNMDSCGDAGIRAWRYRASSPTPAPPSSVSAVSSMPELLGTNSNHSGSYGSSGGPNPPGGAVKNGVSGAMPFFGNSTGSAVSLNNHMGDANSNSSSSSSSSSSSLSSASSSQHSQRHRANSWSEGQSTCLPRSTSWQSNSNNNNAQDTSGTPTPTTSASGAAAGIGWSSPRTPRLYGSGVDSGGSSGGGSGVSGGWSPRVRGEGERERGGGSLNVPSSPATREAARLAEGGLLLGFFQSVQKSASTGDLEGLLQHASQQEASSNSAATPASSSSSSFSSSSSSSSATDRSAFPRFPPTSPQRSPPPMPVLELAPTNLTFGSSSYLNDLLYSSGDSANNGSSGSGISSGDSGSSSFYAHHHHPLRVHPTGALHLFPGSPNSAAAAAAATAAAATFLPASAPVIDGAFAAPPTSQSPLLAVDETSRTDLFFDASSSSSSLPAVTPEEGHPPRTAPPLPASLYFSALQRTASRKVTPESRGNLSATGDGQSSSVPPSSLPSPQISPALSAQSTHSNEGASLSSAAAAAAATTATTATTVTGISSSVGPTQKLTPGSASKRKAPPREEEAEEMTQANTATPQHHQQQRQQPRS